MYYFDTQNNNNIKATFNFIKKSRNLGLMCIDSLLFSLTTDAGQSQHFKKFIFCDWIRLKTSSKSKLWSDLFLQGKTSCKHTHTNKWILFREYKMYEYTGKKIL